MVITIHTMLPVKYGDLFDNSLVLLSCLIGDAVAVFWFIGGCFIFNGELDYRKRVKKSFERIAVPMLCISIIWFFFEKTAVSGSTLAESFSHNQKDYIAIYKSLLRWKSPVLGYYWYLFTYLLIILCFPVLHSFVKYLDGNPAAEKGFLIISFAFFALNDFCRNETFYFSQNSVIAAVPASVEMIWGHIVYRNREKLKFKGSRFLWGFLFILLTLLRWRIQMRHYVTNGSTHILYWYTSLSLLCVSCLLLFTVQFFTRPSDIRLQKAVYYNGASTLLVYLLHEPVRMILYRFGFRETLESMTINRFHGTPGEILYTLAMTFTIYFLCLLLIMLWDLLRMITGKIFRNLKRA